MQNQKAKEIDEDAIAQEITNSFHSDGAYRLASTGNKIDNIEKVMEIAFEERMSAID